MYYSMAEMSVAEMSVGRNVRGRNVRGRNVLAETSVAEMSVAEMSEHLTEWVNFMVDLCLCLAQTPHCLFFYGLSQNHKSIF